MRRYSVERELKSMIGIPGIGSNEITLPNKIIREILERSSNDKNQVYSIKGRRLMAWINKKKNIEIRLLSPDYEVNGILVTCLVRKHGGSIAITFPYIIRDMFKTLKKPLKKFKIFVNKEGNIEFEPIFPK